MAEATDLQDKANARLLVVDDEPLARERMVRMVNKLEDCEVVAEAENVQQALDAINQRHVGFVQMGGRRFNRLVQSGFATVD